MLAVFLINYQKIINAIKKLFKKNNSKVDIPTPTVKQENPDISFGEDLVEKKIEEQNNKQSDEKLTVEPFIIADESELKELEAKSHGSGGRRSGDIKTISNIDVQVEDLEDQEQLVQTDNKKQTIADQIKNLPPEVKALILSNIFDKKDK